MGISDTEIHTVTCEECSIVEEAKVLDNGSSFGGSHWQGGAKFKKFDTSWSGGGMTAPTLVKATCKQCGADAKSDSRFGGP